MRRRYCVHYAEMRSSQGQIRSATEAAWRTFLADGDASAPVRPEIRRSWERARTEWRVDPGLKICPAAQDLGDVLARAGAEEPLRAVAPLVRDLAERLAPDGHVVGYFDAAGVMLLLDGNHRTRDRLADVNFAPGACWAEHVAGTNGIGTAIVEARPVEVFAAEHFVEAWQPWTCASVPVRWDGHLVGVVDITSPWEAHHPALLGTAEALARAVEARLDAAAARREAAVLSRASAAARAQHELLAAASHELRTPLTPLQLRLQQLERSMTRSGGDVDRDRLAQALHGATQDVGRLAAFIDDLVEAAHAAWQPLHVDAAATDLCAIVREVVGRQRDALVAHRCEVRVDAPREVVGRWDAGRIAIAFKHLLGNAMRYAPGPIEVRVEAVGSSASIAVRDHGPGIRAEDRERIFLPFERAVSYRNVAGFGVGLHVVQQIARAHRGAVRLDSAPGRGATFTLELPLVVDADAARGPSIGTAPTGA